MPTQSDDRANLEGRSSNPCLHALREAPCEPVCPVHATVHSSEASTTWFITVRRHKVLFEQLPLQRRRFNFFLYQIGKRRLISDAQPGCLVRSRGVMEKCIYCVSESRRPRFNQRSKADRARRRIVTAVSRSVRLKRLCSATSTIRTARFRS